MGQVTTTRPLQGEGGCYQQTGTCMGKTMYLI